MLAPGRKDALSAEGESRGRYLGGGKGGEFLLEEALGGEHERDRLGGLEEGDE